MRTRRRTAAALILLVLLGGMAAAQTGDLSASQDTITTSLGGTITASVLLTNPKGETDTYRLRVDTVMDNGNAAVTIDAGDEEGDAVLVEVGGGQTRTLPVSVEGSACPGTACTGTATFIATSQTTDERYTEPVNIVVRRNSRIHGSPGLTWPYLLAIATVASLVLLLRG